MARCAICKFPLRADEETMHCPECGTNYHTVCWQSIGGCAVYGCKAAATPDPKSVPEIVGKGWGDEKQCPVCSRTIAASLLVCDCGAHFPWAEPMSRADYRDWLDAQRVLQQKRNVLIWLFVASLFAFPAPFVGAAAGYLTYRDRHDLGGQYGAFLALGYGTAIIGLVYALIIVAVIKPI